MKAHQKVEIFKLALATSRTKRIYSEHIEILCQKIGGTFEIPTTIQAIQQDLCKAQQELKTTVKESTAHQDKHLKVKLTALKIAVDPKEVMKWRNMTNA
jgi:hypothetical protein